jgi:hypothetical protein
MWMLCYISLGDGDLLQLPVGRGTCWDCFLCSQAMASSLLHVPDIDERELLSSLVGGVFLCVNCHAFFFAR